MDYINKVEVDGDSYIISNLTDGTHTVHLPELTDDDEFALRGSVDTDLAKLEQGKADKKAPSAVNNVALLDASGNLVDSGKQLTPEGIGAESKGAGLYSGFTKIPANADLNDYTACGYYCCSIGSVAITVSNIPSREAFTLRVSNSVGGSDHDAIDGKTWRYRMQTFTDYSGREYVRYMRTGAEGTIAFGEWKKTITNVVPSKANNVALLDTSGDLLDSGKQLTAASIGAITTSSGAVGTDNLANRSVTNAKIAFGAVSTETIANNAITTAKIADGAITENTILDGTITTNKIATGAITASKIADRTITADKIVDGVLPTITLGKDEKNGAYIYVLDINGEQDMSIKEATSENIETALGYKPADPSKFLPLTGGTLTGNLTGKYLTGTWLQATDMSRLGSTATKFAVLDDKGWIYYRTASDMQTDLGIPTKDWVTAQIQSAVDTTWEASY